MAYIIKILSIFIALPFVFIIRLVGPILKIRIGIIISSRLGHFVGNTEIYFCEREIGINKPKQWHIDIFYMNMPICNQQMAKLIKREIIVFPYWLLYPIHRVNRMIPNSVNYEVGTNTQEDRDVHNLLDKFLPHLKFTKVEEVEGLNGLNKLGVPIDKPFVCINVRDRAYLPGKNWSYHNYRDCNIKNFVLIAEELADRGYYIIRMGAKVHDKLISNNSQIIDYANNGMRSDFMDIYLGAKCAFAVSTGTGWDSIPEMFRRPVVYVNFMPFVYLHTSRRVLLSITKKHIWKESRKTMTLREIISSGAGSSYHSEDYELKGIDIIENTPEEIRDTVIEMEERLSGKWQSNSLDEILQQRFWKIFPTDSTCLEGKPLHGEVRARFGAAFLRNNQEWLQ